MSTCALVGSVDFNSDHFLGQDFDYVIAVDGGLKHLQAINVVPDLALGDFDSLGFVPDSLEVLTFPTHKDESDIELALYHAFEAGHDTLVVYGCLAGRLDMTYAVLQLLTHFSQAGARVFAVGEDTIATAITGGKHNSLVFSQGAHGTLSAFAATEVATGVNEVGLEYLLDNATLKHDVPLGVSNAFTGAPSSVSVREGTLTVFFPVQAWDFLELRV